VTIRRETRRETQRETQIVARATLHVRARGQAGFTTAISDGGGTLVATLEADDALAADNTRYAAPAARPLTRVALIGANAFLEAALQANQTVTRLEATSGVPDVVVCLGCAEAPPGDSGVLQAGEASGATIAPAPLTVVAPEHPLVRGISLDGVMARPLARRPTPDGSLPAGAVVIARAGERPAIIAIEATMIATCTLEIVALCSESPKW